jgi:VWFA-related protein
MTERKTGTLVRCLLIPVTIFFAAMAISGCGGAGSSKSSPTLTPNISLEVVGGDSDFGIVVLGKSADKNIRISNTGTGTLTIGPINPPTSPFSVIDSNGCSNGGIPAGQSCVLTIRFTPTEQIDYTDGLDIPSNDADAPLLTATFAGRGRALNMSINRVTVVGQTVQVIVSVRDGSDAPVTTLGAGNFSLFENGSLFTGIVNVSNTMTPPTVSVGMVLDYSSSTLGFETEMETAAKSFVDLLDPANDEAEVIKFADVIELMEPFTDNQVALKAAIDQDVSFTRSGTRLFDALWESINSTSLRSSQRLAIVAVSDGRDEGQSTREISDVTAGALDNNVQIFTIGIGAADNAVLQQLATQTGGQYFFAPALSDLETVYTTISEILSNEYTIEYTTSSAAGSTILLDVVVDDGGDLGEASSTVDI